MVLGKFINLSENNFFFNSVTIYILQLPTASILPVAGDWVVKKVETGRASVLLQLVV